MSYDEQTRQFLERANSAKAPPPGTQSLADFRAAVSGFKSLGFDSEPVAVCRDLEPQLPSGQRSKARLFVPEAAAPPPLVVWAHGGSWVRVDVDLMDGYFRALANRSGCAVLAVDYRLSPESQFPAAIEEIYGSATWARAHADEIGVDGDRIGVGGESSGANLAAAAALLARSLGEFQFSHQTLVVPLLDAAFDSPSWDALGTGYLLTKAQLEWALEMYAPGVDRRDPLLSPLRAPDHSDLPSALIVTGEYDPLRDDGERYADALRSAGVEVDLRRYDGLIHHAVMAPKAIDLGVRMITETAIGLGAALRQAQARVT